MGFKVWGSGIIIFCFLFGGRLGYGFRVRVQVCGFRMSTFEVQGSGLGFRVQAS